MSVLPRPLDRDDKTGPELWIDEAIWGHRLHDEQTPWLTFLEFLGIFQSEGGHNRALIEDAHNTLSYKPQQQLRLRNLLFNNPHIVTVPTEIRQEEDKWSIWLQRMKETAGGLDSPDFGYLRNHFDNFQDLAAVIAFLQSSAIEGNSNKRWSSKFAFPFGGNSLYEDVSVSASNGVSNDRRFFGRTGEILYLMLCRSSRARELSSLVATRLLSGEGSYDRIVGLLQGKPEFARQARGGSYLPLAEHPSFERLSEDWLALLNCRVPTYDIIPHLVTMTGLNLILYQLERAREILGRAAAVQMVCEIIGPKRTKVRELSEKSFQSNQVIPGQAVEQHIRAIMSTAEWQVAEASEHPRVMAAELLAQHFDWENDEIDDPKTDPRQLVEMLVVRAQVRHRQHVGRFHGAWSRLISLSSRRSSRSTRYAPTDRLLKTLVVCRVDRRLEFRAFLEMLHSRYGILVGDQQAGELTERGAADHEDFSDNARRLEERLASLGLLERFSDSCAYVVNPFERVAS